MRGRLFGTPSGTQALPGALESAAGSAQLFLLFLVVLALASSVGFFGYLKRDEVTRLLRRLKPTAPIESPVPRAPQTSPTQPAARLPATGLQAAAEPAPALVWYRPDSTGEQLAQTQVALPPATAAEGEPGEDPPRSRLEQVLTLLFQPNPEAGAAGIPEGTRLAAYFLTPDGTLYLDVNEAFRAQPQGSWSEAVGAYAVVNTLTSNFPEVRRVQFLVEGKPATTLAGHLDLSRPLGARALTPLQVGPQATPQPNLQPAPQPGGDAAPDAGSPWEGGG
ncbi:MAG: GerMN domain-containing protein [Candidatus Tectomicrobia bacterium]|nr:GerMN domain-containing protein [Candidatus Tectomicrobia bacterium]